MSPGGAGSYSHNNKSSLLLSFKKEESSFLKKRRRPPGGKQKIFIFMRPFDRAFLLRGVFSGG
jgi:hypothetical protein